MLRSWVSATVAKFLYGPSTNATTKNGSARTSRNHNTYLHGCCKGACSEVVWFRLDRIRREQVHWDLLCFYVYSEVSYFQGSSLTRGGSRPFKHPRFNIIHTWIKYMLSRIGWPVVFLYFVIFVILFFFFLFFDALFFLCCLLNDPTKSNIMETNKPTKNNHNHTDLPYSAG